MTPPPSLSTLSKPDKVVSVSYASLVEFQEDKAIRQELVEKIGQAFGDGETCLGILAVTGVPNFDAMRRKLLPMARQLALLCPTQLDSITDDSSGYQVGWSHGKEKVEGDKLDLGKGSFYANPLTDNVLHERPDTDPDIAKANPAFYAPNVWPTESLPDLEPTLKELGQLVCHVGRLLARPCDAYVKTQCPDYPDGKLERVLNESVYCKARLLHYFAPAEQNESSNAAGDESFSDWCGWHNDHGSLTGLIPALYLDTDGNVVDCPDDKAGLYIKSRSGQRVHLQVSTLAFQIGETSQIHTGGILQATPHAVRGCRSTTGDDGRSISRESFAVFMEPEFDGDMELPPTKTIRDIQRHTSHLPKTVRTLQSRFHEGMTFGDFSNATFAAFY